MADTATRPVPARQRLLEAADELFYAEGVHTVGIDRVIERAGVAKASLYSTFGSKDALVRAYLLGKHELIIAHLAKARDLPGPRDQRVLAVFDLLGELHEAPTFRGCPFVNASGDAPDDGTVREVSTIHRDAVRGLFRELAADAGLTDTDSLARQLLLLYDGASIAAQLDRDPAAASSARRAAAALVAAAS
jgi:AcrR family transcriptional regulator